MLLGKSFCARCEKQQTTQCPNLSDFFLEHIIRSAISSRAEWHGSPCHVAHGCSCLLAAQSVILLVSSGVHSPDENGQPTPANILGLEEQLGDTIFVLKDGKRW